MASVAVIGGGISGLSCAYYLRKLGRDVVKKVILSEKQTTLGGCIQTTRFPDGTVYEHGPHNLRVVGKAGFNSLVLVDELGLAPDILHLTSSHPSVKNRFILVNNQLCHLPSRISDIFRKRPPFEKAFFWYILKELKTRRGTQEDESMDNFARRRFGDEIADFIVDPLCRGISAGSSKELGIRSFMPNFYKAEQEHGSVIRGQIKMTHSSLSGFLNSDLAVISMRDKWSSWTLKNGIQQLPIALEAYLKSDEGVELYHNIPCDKINFERDKATVYFEGDSLPTEFDHVFACIPAKKLSKIVSLHHPELAQPLSTIQSVHVAVVNLEYRGKPVPLQSFGYLVPSSQKSKILGVIFNSCCFPEHDGKYYDKTRLTCMLGGRWFHEYFGDVVSVNPDDLLSVAVSEVGQHLNIKEKPIRHHVKVQKNCIAQYRVGHHKTIESIEQQIRENSLCLSVTGSSFNGLAVNECIYNARVAVEKYLDTLRS